MKKILFLIAFTFLMPIIAHAETLAPRVSSNPIFITPPAIQSSKVKGFEGYQEWGDELATAYFKKQIDANTVQYCSLTQNHPSTFSTGQAAVINQANGTTGICDDVDTKTGEVTLYETVDSNGLHTHSEKVDTSGTKTTSDGAGLADVKYSTGEVQQKSGCELGNVLCYITSGIFDILAKIAYGFMWLSSGILGIVGTFFNWIVVITVFQFGVFFGNSQGMLLAWGILRDVGNILILFGFLYAGLMMILDLHSFNARKTIPLLIIFAVLLNFSLFAGEAVVDVSNVLSAKLYQQAGQSVFSVCSSLTSCTNQVGIAEVIMQDTGVGSAFSFSSASDPNKTALSDSVPAQNRFFAYTGVAILVSIVMMLLLTASIMLLVRAVTLVVLLVTSPIGFVGFAIPQLEGQAKKWWESLISNAFFAPIFLLLLFVGLKVMEGLRQALSGANQQTLLAALSNPNVTLGSILIIFALIVGFFIAALMFAKSSGAAGAAFATSFAQKTVLGGWSRVGNTAAGAGRGIGGGITRLGGIGARKLVGGGATKFARNYDATMGAWRKEKSARGMLARGWRLIGGDEATENMVHSAQNAKFGTKRSFNQQQKFVKDRTAHLNHAAHLAHNEHDALGGIGADANSEAYAKAERAIQDMSANDLKSLMGRAKDKNFAKLVGKLANADKFADFMKDHDFDSDLKEGVSDGRFGDYHALKVKLDEATDQAAKEAAFKKLQEHLGEFTEKDLESALLYDASNAQSTFGIISPDGKGSSVIKSDDARKSLAKKTSIPKQLRKIIHDAEKSEQLKKLMDQANGGDSAALGKIQTLMAGNNMKKDVADVGEDKIFSNGNLTSAGATFISNLDNAGKLKGLTEKEFSPAAYSAIVSRIKTNGSAQQQKILKEFLKGNNAQIWGRTYNS